MLRLAEFEASYERHTDSANTTVVKNRALLNPVWFTSACSLFFVACAQ